MYGCNTRERHYTPYSNWQPQAEAALAQIH